MPRPVNSDHAGVGQATVGDAGRDDQRVGADLRAIGHAHADGSFAGSQLADLVSKQEIGAEALGLGGRAAGQILAGEAGREAEVVLDAGAHAGLTAGGMALDDGSAQPFRCAVDGRGQAGWSTADDDQVVDRDIERAAQAGLLGDGLERRVLEDRAVAEEQDRELARARAGQVEQLLGGGVGRDVEPLERDLVAGEEIAHVVGFG